MESQMDVRGLQIEIGFVRLPLPALSARKLENARQMAAALLGPLALLAFAMSAWRLTSDLGWTGAFVIPRGVLSHWMTWGALGIGTQALATAMRRAPREN